MSLKYKLLLGFIIPAAMLVVAGYWSSSQMRTIGQQVETMLEENERSIRYAVMMNEAVERIDSGILMKLQGDEISFNKIIDVSRADFKTAFKSAYENITLPGEKEILDSLRILADSFFSMVQEMSDSSGLEFYHQRIFPIFGLLQRSISDLRWLNSEAMYSTAQNLVDRASRAALPGDLIILAAVVFALLFSILTQIYIFQPFKAVLQAVIQWRKTGNFKSPAIPTNDEIRLLSQELLDISSRQSG